MNMGQDETIELNKISSQETAKPSTNGHPHAHDEHRDDEGSKLGMWLFLFTELLLFGGLFLVYAIYRSMNSEAFHHASEHLDVFLGTVNTVVLITSSATVAMAITALQKGSIKLAQGLLWGTILAAVIFMINKYFEWGYKFEHGIIPGSESFKEMIPGEQLFYLLYFFMTGLHGLHVVVGAIFIIVVIRRINQKRQTADNFALTENAGLYWHLVDLIWIFLFPLLYLIR